MSKLNRIRGWRHKTSNKMLSSVRAAGQKTMVATFTGFAPASLRAALCGVVVLVTGAAASAQQTGFEFAANGDISLISKNGHRTRLVDHGHCNEVSGTPDGRLFACLVSRGVDDNGYRPQFQIEIYHDDGRKLLVEPGGSIRDWHFWKNDRQVAVSFNASDGHIADALYDVQSGKLVESLEEPADPAQLPPWAKCRLQIDDESVPVDAASQQMRNKWMNKTLRQIGTIQPGMHRRDLATLFRQDGGLSSFGQGRYVLKECPMIKIDVKFKSPDGKSQLQQESPDDIIDSVSKPYLQWPFAD